MMALYIRPKGISKEAWLKRNATSFQSTRMPTHTRKHDGQLEMVVCLVDNGEFTTAGVAITKDELEALDDGWDHCDKVWYWVPVARLEEVLGLTLEVSDD